mmetsp:Transcript_43938/g.70302  ORF Transcript_43938/g.70302 Transcript_43938/m.70302 type:complete len:216 (+) Transcript_43938:2094-2741(+)
MDPKGTRNEEEPPSQVTCEELPPVSQLVISAGSPPYKADAVAKPISASFCWDTIFISIPSCSRLFRYSSPFSASLNTCVAIPFSGPWKPCFIAISLYPLRTFLDSQSTSSLNRPLLFCSKSLDSKTFVSCSYITLSSSNHPLAPFTMLHTSNLVDPLPMSTAARIIVPIECDIIEHQLVQCNTSRISCFYPVKYGFYCQLDLILQLVNKQIQRTT